MGERTKRFWRTIEWLLALAWPFVAYNAVFERYGWKSEYYNKWDETWFALVLLIPMLGPLLTKLFSANGMDTQKRLALAVLMACGLAVAIKYRPTFGGVSFKGFFVPMALYALAVFLWFNWQRKKSLPAAV